MLFAPHMPLHTFHRYLFLLAHPDDEIYACVLIRDLCRQGKAVKLVYATRGDAKSMAAIRTAELQASMQRIGLPNADLHLLGVPERDVLDRMGDIVEGTLALGFRPDVVVGHDYEGGHEAHDALCFCATEVAQRTGAAQVVFPLYHGKPPERQGARFKPGRTGYLTYPLDADGAALKQAVMAIHASQAAHFAGLQHSAPDYLDLLTSREVFLLLQTPPDYSVPPMPEVGYAFHRNGFTFSDFQRACVACQGQRSDN
ncbi:MAG: PIG-L family deacetylase [Bacteroidia bacterium]